MFSGVIEAKINTYLELGTNDNSMSYSTSFILLKGFANRCVLLILFLFEFKESVRKNDRLLNGLLNVYVFGTILYCSLLPLSISLARVAVYMDIVQIFDLNNFGPSKTNGKSIVIVLCALVLLHNTFLYIFNVI